MKGMRILMFLCGAMIATGASAQFKIEVGAKAGLNNAGLNLSSSGKSATTNYNTRADYHLGAYALIRSSKISKFAFQPELVFSKQGQNYSTTNNTNLHTVLGYINVPLMLKYYLIGGLNFQAGPQFGLLMFSKGDLLKLNGSGAIQGQPLTNQDLGKYIKSTDFSIAFGAGLDLPFGTSITIRYNVGISDINKFTNTPLPNSTKPSVSTAYTRNQVFQISIGYRIKKFGK